VEGHLLAARERDLPRQRLSAALERARDEGAGGRPADVAAHRLALLDGDRAHLSLHVRGVRGAEDHDHVGPGLETRAAVVTRVVRQALLPAREAAREHDPDAGARGAIALRDLALDRAAGAQ